MNDARSSRADAPTPELMEYDRPSWPRTRCDSREESPPPPSLFELRHPLVVGLTTAPKRLIEIRRNRLLSLNETTETAYVDEERVEREVAFARRLFADNGWPVIDVTRRSIEETAAAIIRLMAERGIEEPGSKPI